MDNMNHKDSLAVSLPPGHNSSPSDTWYIHSLTWQPSGMCKWLLGTK